MGTKSDHNLIIITNLRAFMQFNLSKNVPFSLTCVCVCVCLVLSFSSLCFVRGHKVVTVGDRSSVMTSFSRFTKS